MMQVLGDRVLVVLPPPDLLQDAATGFTVQDAQDTASGLVIAKPGDTYNPERQSRGIVVQLGRKAATVDLDDVMAVVREHVDAQNHYLEAGRHGDALLAALKTLGPAPFDVQVGEFVIFSPASGEAVSLDDGNDYVILRESDIIGVWEPDAELAPAS